MNEVAEIWNIIKSVYVAVAG